MAPSPVWTYFAKSADGGVKCSKCGAFFTKPSTSTLYYHLSHVHFINLKKLPPKGRPQAHHDRDNEDEESVDDPDPVNASQGNDPSDAAAAPRASTSGARSRSAGPRPPVTIVTSPRPRSESQPRSFSEGPMDRCLSTAAAFSRGGARDAACTEALLYMICKDDMPKRTVEREGFKKFVSTLQPLYHLPSEPTVTVKLEAKYEELKEKVGAELASAQGLSLTADIWTHSDTMTSYLGMTAHFRKGKQIICVELGARPMPERKTIENLRAAMREICADWQIDYDRVRGVVTDGGANIKGAARAEFGADKHITCVAHVLNGIGQAVLKQHVDKPPSEQEPAEAPRDVPENEDEAENQLDDEVRDAAFENNDSTVCVRALLVKVKKIVRFFKSSDVATQELKERQMEDGKKEHECLKLIQEVRTRWNSSYYMVERFLLLADPISRVLFKLQREKRTRSKPPNFPTTEELDLLTEVRDLMAPLEEATRVVSKSKAVSLCHVIPFVTALKAQVGAYMPVSGLAFNLKENLLSEIEKRFSVVELVRPYAAATLLDPRYKKWAFESSQACANIIHHLSGRITDMIKEAGRALEAQQEQESTGGAEATPATGIWASLDKRIKERSVGIADQEATATIPSQLKAYLSTPPLDRAKNPNPLVTWEAMRVGLEYVYDLAMEYLPIMATSTAAERLFSHAGLIATQIRNRLSPKHLNQLVFLRSVDADVWFS